MRSLVIFALTMLIFGAVVLSLLSHQESNEARVRRISAAQGIIVAYGNPKSFALPSHSNDEIFPEGIHAEASEPAHIAAALDGIEQALASYPRGFVSKLVRAVFIVGVLHAGKGRASGTIGAEWILVAAPKDRELIDIREMSQATFHHELSSAVLRQNGALARWTRFWPSGRTEIHGYDEIARQPEDSKPDPATGFLSAYALTNPENDFNVYAEEMFVNPTGLKTLAQQHEIVRNKLACVMSLYSDLDVRMTEGFRRLALR